jgi:beta-glucanase (GH16 family)
MLIAAAVLLLSPGDPKSGKHLVFDDEFNGKGNVNQSNWYYDNSKPYNNEAERYTSSPENSSLQHGSLVITALKNGDSISSARLVSKKTWLYGYFEIRAKVPPGKGTWPAIWMLNDYLRKNDPAHKVGWPRCGEIDIMENVGFDPSNFHFSLHSDNFNWQKKQQRTKVVPADHPTDKYHLFGLDWQPNYITFYMDHQPVYHVDKPDDDYGDWPFKEPFYMILNLAIGGFWGGQKGIDPAIFPAKFYVDYVRIYQ